MGRKEKEKNMEMWGSNWREWLFGMKGVGEGSGISRPPPDGR